MGKRYVIAIGILLSVLCCNSVLQSQAPQAFKFQSVIRNTEGVAVADKNMGIFVSILKGNESGQIVFSEYHSVKTNTFGIVNLNIGEGSLLTGSFDINWAADKYFIKLEFEENGIRNASLSNVSRLLSVPYALNAQQANSIDWIGIQNKPVLFSGNYSDLKQLPDLSQFLKSESDPLFQNSVAKGIKASDTTRWGNNQGGGFSGNYNDLTNKPILDQFIISETDPLFSISIAKGITANDTSKWNKKVSFSGNYNDLTNKPTLFDGTWGSLTNKPVLFDGTWGSLANKPTIKDTIKAYLDTTSVFIGKPDSLKKGDMVYFDGTNWVRLPIGNNKDVLENKNGVPKWKNTKVVGEFYGGGIVFFVDDSGKHGLICGLKDLSYAQDWSNNINAIIGTTSQSQWDGASNTAAIIGQAGHTASAALICSDYGNIDYGTGVFSDWYLPAIDELSLLFQVKYTINKAIEQAAISNTEVISLNLYWSSTENDSKYSWYWPMSGGAAGINKKSTTAYVRPIRAF